MRNHQQLPSRFAALRAGSGRRAAAVAATALAAIALGACGGGSDDDQPAAAAGGGDRQACVTQARAAVDAARREPKLVTPDPLAVDELRGRSFWIILAVNTPATADVAAGYKAAAEAVGARATVFDGKGQVQRWSDGVEQAIAQKADGLMLLSIPPDVLEQPLARAAKRGMVVVDSFNGSPDAPLTDGVFAHATFDAKGSGRMLADWVLADSECQASPLILGSELLPLHKDMMDGAVARIDELCPECSAETLNIDTATMATKLGSRARAALQQNPDIDYLVPVLDAAVTYLQPAAAAAGREIKIVGHDGVDASLEFIREGRGQVADGALPPLSILGWAGLDQVARGVLDEDPSDLVVPVRLIDETNVGEAGTNLFPAYEGYEQRWVEAWRR